MPTSDKDETKRYKERRAERYPGRGEFVMFQLKKWCDNEREDAPPPIIYAEVVNISEGGLRLDIPSDKQSGMPPDPTVYHWPPRPSDRIVMLLTGPRLPAPVRAEGEIVSLETGDPKGDYRVSLKFVGLSEKLRDMLQVGLVRMQIEVIASQKKLKA